MRYVAYPFAGTAGQQVVTYPTGTLLRIVPNNNIAITITEVSYSMLNVPPRTHTQAPLLELGADTSVSGGTLLTSPWAPVITSLQDSVPTVAAVTSYQAEPTYTGLRVLKSWHIPTIGGKVVQYPLGRKPILVGNGTRGITLRSTLLNWYEYPACYVEFEVGTN